jgi:DHA2 family multidrug resistance protein-like MFS transporter
MLVSAIGIALMAQVGESSGFGMLIVGSCVMAAGFTPPAALGTDLVIRAAPPERAGAASAASETSNEFGGALGLAILGSVGTAVYRSGMSDSLPDGVSPGAAEVASDTLAGATAVAAELPGEVGGTLLALAQGAFTDGFRATAVVSAVIVLAGAVLAAVLLRRVGAPESPATGAAGPAVEPSVEVATP